MSLLSFVNGLAARGIELWTSEGKLQYKAPKELVTPDLVAELKQKKTELIELLLEFSASTGTYPLSYAQKSLWSLHQLNPQSAAYNVMYAAQLADDLDVGTLRRCFDYLVARHPILRTRYGVIDGRPQQKVETIASAGIEVQDAAAADDAYIRAWIDREANQPFDLTVSPIRLKLLACSRGAGAKAARSHILLINVHHIAADFWSLEILVRELSLLYRMVMQGQPPKLPPIELQYKDCVQHEAERLQGADGQALVAFWERELAGEVPVLNLPTDFMRPPVKTENGKVFMLDLGASVTKAIKDAAKANQVTPYMLLLSVYQLFLFLHSGQSRILIGAPTAGRETVGSEAVMGHFVNTVVLPCRLDRSNSFVALLTNTRAMMLRVLEHQQYPFPLLVEKLRPERDPSRSPLFQVMYNWNQAHRESKGEIEGSERSLVQGMLAASSTGTRGATHDLTLNIYDYGPRYVTAWTFNTDLFGQATIERFAQQFERLVQQVLADPSRSVVSYSLVDQSRRAPMFERVLAAAQAAPSSSPVVLGFLEVARDRPDALALVCNDQSVRYEDLLHAFFTVRSKLIELGVKAGTRVGARTRNIGELGVVALALCDIEADLYLLPAEAHASDMTVLDVIVSGSSSASPWAPANLQFAHGGGGTHADSCRGLTPAQFDACVRGIQEMCSLSPASRVLSFPGADQHLALATIVGTWLCAAQLHAPVHLTVDAIADGSRRFAEYIERNAISTLAVPSALAGSLAEEDLRSLDTLVLVGDSSLPPPPHREDTAVRLLPAFALDLPCRPISFAWSERRWMLNPASAAVVLSALDDVVDDDMSGRLCLLVDLAGAAPSIVGTTDQCEWIEQPPRELTGQRLLKTPCMAMRSASGSIVYEGSTTRSATHRITPFSLDRVEACIAGDDEVAQAFCLVRDVGGEPAVVAYVRLKHPGASDAADCEQRLRKLLRRHLPEYMHPSAYVFVDVLPLTATGTLDAKRLPMPEAAMRRGHIAPRNEIEEKLAAIWREALSLETIGVHDNFFELGGDSILGAVIISRAGAQGLYFVPRDIFENASIAELALVVRSAPDVRVDQGAVSGKSPLAPAQAWFFEHVRSDLSHFNQALLVKLNQVPDAALLERALRAVAEHHDVLRSRFSFENGRWMQVFDTDAGISSSPKFSVISGEAAADQAIRDAQASLDIEKGEVFKALWLDRGSLEESRLLIVAHHLVIDGLSWSVLLEDIDAAYSQLGAGGEAHLPLKTTSYKDWVEKLHGQASSESMATDATFWQQVARKAVAARLASSFMASRSRASQEAGSASRAIVLNRELSAAFRSKAHQAYNTDANDLLLAALYAGFSAWSSSAALLIDVEGHGREPLEGVNLSRTLGWFTSIYPVLLEIDDTQDRPVLIKRVKQQLRDIPSKGMGYGILRYIGGAAELAQMPKAPVLFTYLGQLDQLAARSGLYASAIEPAPAIRSPRQGQTHLLDVCAYVTDGRLTIQCTFDSGQFVPQEIDLVLANVQRELTGLIEHCLDPEAGGMTPSDTPDLDLDQDELDELLNEVALLDE